MRFPLAVAAAAALCLHAGCAPRVVGIADHRPEPTIAQELRNAVVPSTISLTYQLRQHLAAQTHAAGPQGPAALRRERRRRDLRRLDSLYVEALGRSDGNVHEALFALSVATLPYHRFPAVLPLLGIGVSVPVSLESEESFALRMRALPSMLFDDTPLSGDRDKLPHFFGSAWLSLMIGVPDLAAACGDAIEVLETIFKLEGASDARDRTMNRLGVRFAERLRRSPATLPSSIIRRAHALTTR